MSEDIIQYVIKFKNGNFYTHSEGINVFESYTQAKNFLKNRQIEEDFELINEKEIIYKPHDLCLIWSKTNKIIWKQAK